jgi:5'-3' exonuclease
MSKNGRHTLVIDGNYFLFRTLHVLPKPSKSKSLLDGDDEVQSFMAKLATDFSYQVRLFDGLIDKIVWTADSRSWRKDFYPEADYKGNRKLDGGINWDNFSKVSEDFISILNRKGVHISKIAGAEGDDLMYAWNTESLANNKSVIMFTGDRDIVQLVNKSSNGCHTILFSPAHKKLYTYQGFSEWMNADDELVSTDIFDMMKVSVSPENQSKKLLQNLVKKKKVAILEVDPEEFRFMKVLTGDSGDNVSPAYWYTLNGRRYGISEKKASEIVSEFKQKHGTLSHMYLYNNEYVVDLANIIIRIMKAKHMNREQIISNIRSNVNLMVLSAESIPEGILDDMFKLIESSIHIKNLNLNEISSMKTLLENTSYKTDESSISISSKIFSNDSNDSSSDFSFIKDRKTQNKIF